MALRMLFAPFRIACLTAAKVRGVFVEEPEVVVRVWERRRSDVESLRTFEMPRWRLCNGSKVKSWYISRGASGGRRGEDSRNEGSLYME